MLRKVLFLLTVTFALPIIAEAASWSLNTWAKASGGNIVVRNGTPQTNTNGSVFKSYTTSQTFNVTVNANTGYTISSVTYNNVVQTLPIASPATYSVHGPTSQSITASFSPQLLSVTASAGAGGTVTPRSIGSIYYGQKLYSPIKFTFTPKPGFRVNNISGVPAGATVNSALPAPVNSVIVVTFPTAFTFTADVALAGTFTGPPVANAGPPQTVLPSNQVTLDGSTSSGSITTYTWQQISGPGFPATKVIADNTTGIQVNFMPTVVGTYWFRLTVSEGSTATTSVIVTTDVAAVGRSQCQNCHQANGVGTANNVYDNWSSSVHRTNLVMCANCHIGANTGGHPGSLNTMTVDRYTFTLIGPANGGAVGSSFCAQCHNDANQIVTDFMASPHKQKPNGPTTCSGCHGDAHTVTATVNPCRACHADTAGNIVGHAIIIGTTPCFSCHNPHTAVAGACDSCHECPPATASHIKHYSGTVAQAAYGDVRIARDFSPNATGYIMNCGNCHPMNSAKHMDGVVEVELASPLAPAGSLKALNPASAAYVAGAAVFTDNRGYRYTMGTCSNIYCHSYTDWTTPGGVPLVTDCLPDSTSYWPPNLLITRMYKTITWGGGALSCSGCHANPPRSAYPANDGGAGNSHSWIDNDGYEDLHSWNMGFEPVGCKFCHYDTVQELNHFTRDAMDIATLSDVPISNHSKHVNGINDVSFDKQNPFVYQTYGGTTSMSLNNATYDAPSKTCLNVSCHYNQTSVKWGTPYRYFDYAYECDRCHYYGSCQ